MKTFVLFIESHLKGDKIIWLVALLLGLISLLAVYSSTSALAFRYQGGNTEYYFLKHFFLLLLSFLVMFIVHQFDYKFFSKISFFLVFISIILLVYTLLQGEQFEINEAQRWISFMGQSFQASDFAKFSLIVYLARVLTEKQDHIKDFNKSFLPVILIVSVICGLIAPANLSTAVLLFACSLILMFIAGISLRYIMMLLMIGFFGVLILMFTVRRGETWRNRLRDYIERISSTDYVPNYQTEQANIAISTGGILGKGVGKSVQRNFLPHPYSDFIFAIIVEEYGLIGALIILGLYFVLLFRSLAIITISKTFGALLAAGLSFLIVLQALVNIGVTVGILPVTGLPLPFISMGGTSLLFTGMSLGVILSVSKAAMIEKTNLNYAK
jgi:cell division protein FtsW